MMLKLCVLLFIAKGILCKDCSLDSSQMDKKWIFAVRPTSTTWDILRTDFIRDGQSLYKICNASLIVRLSCKDGTFQQHPPTVQSDACSARIKATVNTNGAVCYSSGRTGHLYTVQYTFSDSSVHPLYHVCYDTIDEMPLYVCHHAYGFSLTAASSYRRPQFTLDKVVTRSRASSFESSKIYDTFQTLLGSHQWYVNSSRDLILERGHLANSQDFISYDQMDETFKYVNVMPQFRGSNRSNWKRIENWIHNLPNSSTYAEVVTGTYGILQLQHSQSLKMIPMYLMSNSKNPIPLWTYKLVRYNNHNYAFITLNNDYNTNATISTWICKSISCPPGLQFNANSNSGVSYCCDYQNFIQNLNTSATLGKSCL